MTASADVADDAPKKSFRMPLVIGVVLALLGGGGGFFAVQSGVLGGVFAASATEEIPVQHDGEALVTATFVALDPMVISLPSAGGRDHLRFAAQLDVAPAFAAEVEMIKPRIVDTLNGYLRALDLATLEDPAALLRLRAQMLRRVQVVAGPGRVNDLLIMEFVLS